MSKPYTLETVSEYGETFENLPVYRTLTENMRQNERRLSNDFPHRYLPPRVVWWAWNNRYITAWEYSFYLSILDKPKPRQLTVFQKTKFHSINRKVNKWL